MFANFSCLDHEVRVTSLDRNRSRPCLNPTLGGTYGLIQGSSFISVPRGSRVVAAMGLGSRPGLHDFAPSLAEKDLSEDCQSADKSCARPSWTSFILIGLWRIRIRSSVGICLASAPCRGPSRTRAFRL